VGEQTAMQVDAIGLAIKRFNAKEESNKLLIPTNRRTETAGNITTPPNKPMNCEIQKSLASSIYLHRHNGINRNAVVYRQFIACSALILPAVFCPSVSRISTLFDSS